MSTTIVHSMTDLDTAISELRSAVAREDRQGFQSSLLGAARHVLRAYDEREDRLTAGAEPLALVCGRDEKRGRRYHLGTQLAQAQPVDFVLDPPLQRGDSVQVTDVGELPANLLAMVRGTKVRFQINATCPECGDWGCHRVEVPDSTWGHPSLVEPYLVRRCVCGNSWRQYAAVVG